MIIIPAIDLRGGRIVRLTNGDYNQSKIYGDSPLDQAKAFEAAGAKYIHIVDLDSAKDGGSANMDIICKIAAETSLIVETGGGIRDEDKIITYKSAGIRRVILGTIAVKNFPFTVDMAQKYGDLIAVGVDASDGRVAVSGWLDVTAIDSVEFCLRLAQNGIKTVIYTDISRDGRLEGANIDIYKKLIQIKNLNIIASGGVSSIADIDSLRNVGVFGAIIGKALYEGKLNLKEIL